MPELSDWETETGLPDDVDGWIKDPYFGVRKEYALKAETEQLMFISPLVNEDGEEVGMQGWSVGTGWIVSEDGQSISHPARKNVVGSCMYGQLQRKVVKELGVNMAKYGMPTEAKSWNGLGFHWKQEEHKTVSGDKKTGLMPTQFLGEREIETAAPSVVAKDTALDAKLTEMAQTMALREFQKAALKVEGVSDDDDLLAAVLDETNSGYWALKNKK